MFGRNIYVRSKFTCVCSSHGLCARTQLRGNIGDDLLTGRDMYRLLDSDLSCWDFCLRSASTSRSCCICCLANSLDTELISVSLFECFTLGLSSYFPTNVNKVLSCKQVKRETSNSCRELSMIVIFLGLSRKGAHRV